MDTLTKCDLRILYTTNRCTRPSGHFGSCGVEKIATPAPVVGDEQCAASPDHADILETIQNAADSWQKDGYTSALAEIRDMANVGRSFMERYQDHVRRGGQFAGWTPADDPTEFVDFLCDTIHGTAIPASLTPDAGERFPDIGSDPMKGDRTDRIEQSIAACRAAYVTQQKGVPDQTALVWRWHLGALLEYATRLKAMHERTVPARLAFAAASAPLVDKPEVLEEITEDDLRHSVRMTLEQPNMTQNLFARVKGISRGHLSEFLAGKRGAEPAIAESCGYRWALVHDTRVFDELADPLPLAATPAGLTLAAGEGK